MGWFDQQQGHDADAIDAALRQAQHLFRENEDAALERALRKLEQLTLMPRQGWSSLLLRGWLYYRQKTYQQAIHHADLVLSQTEDSYFVGRSHQLRGLSFTEQARFSDDEEYAEEKLKAAQSEFERALTLLDGYPERFSVYNSLATLFADMGAPEQAIALLNGALQPTPLDSPEVGWTYAILGELYAQDKHDYGNGIEYLIKSVSCLDPVTKTHSWVHSLVAKCYSALGEYEKATEHGRRAVSLAEQDKGIQIFAQVRAHVEYAFALSRGYMDQVLAEKHLRTALDLVKDNSARADLYVRLGNVLRLQDRAAAALQAYEMALTIDKEFVASSGFYTIVGMVAVQAKAYAKAVKYLEQALAEPMNVDQDEDQETRIQDYYYLGIAQYYRKEYRLAAESFRAGLRIAPVHHEERSSMMKWLLVTNRQIESG